MSYIFHPPTIAEGPAGSSWLFMRYKLNRGISVYKFEGEWYEVRFPSQDLMEEAEIFFIGGHSHKVDEATATELMDLGYDVEEVS